MMKQCCGVLTVTCALLLMATVPASSHAQEGLFQIEGHMFGAWGVRAGLRLGERAVVLAGVEAHFHGWEHDSGFTSVNSGSWSVPLEAKLYLSEASAGSVAPILAFGGSYGRRVWRLETGSAGGIGDLGARMLSTESSSVARAHCIVGVAWFATDAFALDLAAGPFYEHAWLEAPEYPAPSAEHRWGVTWRLAVVVRP